MGRGVHSSTLFISFMGGKMNDKKIVISCPVSNRGKFLPYFLDNLYKLDYPKKLITFYFLINNSHDDTESILLNFKSCYESEYNSINIDYYKKNKNVPLDCRVKDIRVKFTYRHLAQLRNRILQYVSSSDADFLFSVDSDIMVKPDTLKKLLSHDKDIVSSLIWNGYIKNPSNPYLYPNILIRKENNTFTHVSNWYVKNAPVLTESKLIEIDATGAICLISKEVASNTQYGFHSQGEDIFWSIDCKNKGYKLHCDLSAYCEHLMSEELLEKYIEKNYKSVEMGRNLCVKKQ